MSRRSRRKIAWGASTRRETAVSAGPPPEPPEFLGTWQWRLPARFERTEDWMARVARQREAVVGAAANWLRVGQRVRVHQDARAGGGDVCGRIGTIHRVCSPVFADHTYVHFAPQGREKVPRVRMLTLEILEPIE